MRISRSMGVAAIVGLTISACTDRVGAPTSPADDAARAVSVTDVPFSHFGGGGPAAGLELLAEGLTSPVALVQAPDGTGRLFVVDQVGQIRILTGEGVLLAEPFLDLSDRLVVLNPFFDERGLLGLAFHPQFATNGRFFVYYSAPLRAGAPSSFNHTARISEYHAAPGADVASSVESVVLEVDQPQANHNGGTLAFGPADGYLYISLGDGGGANDTGPGHVEDWYEANAGGNAQNVEANLLGKILRIDIEGAPYSIPPDNPFVGRAGLDEIWAYGLRNPYRMSFDMAAPHVLLAGDAGQLLAEEVNLIVRGGNYGWNVREGLYCFNAADNLDPLADCPDEVAGDHPDSGAPLVHPVIAYPNRANPFAPGLGLTVIGGFVYRGTVLPELRGRYVFADFDDRIFVATPRLGRPGDPVDRLWSFQELHFPRRPGGGIGQFVKGFGQDLAGEIYVLGSDALGPAGVSGTVYRLVKAGSRGR
jgi:glucose/arabinose dehydrogenase